MHPRYYEKLYLLEPEKYKDTYQKNLKKIIQAKREDKDLKDPEPAPKSTAVGDLMGQLKKSLKLSN